jgi:hypothetical protein
VNSNQDLPEGAGGTVTAVLTAGKLTGLRSRARVAHIRTTARENGANRSVGGTGQRAGLPMMSAVLIGNSGIARKLLKACLQLTLEDIQRTGNAELGAQGVLLAEKRVTHLMRMSIFAVGAGADGSSLPCAIAMYIRRAIRSSAISPRQHSIACGSSTSVRYDGEATVLGVQ